MATAPTTWTLINPPAGQTTKYSGLIWTDSNGGQAQVTMPWYVNASGILIPAPVDSNGVPQASLAGSNAINHGKTTTSAANTSTQLSSLTGNNVLVVALPTNTGLAYVGSNAQGVTNTSFGAALRAGDSQVFNVTNANLLAVATDVSGEGISYVVTN